MAVPFRTYPPIHAHAVIGDRRTAALVAADGTIDWMCLPHFDGTPVLGALLDASQGGFWRFGPREIVLGEQSYLEDTAVLVTRWQLPHAIVELTDFMAHPHYPRTGTHETRRLLVRKLSCLSGMAPCTMRFEPRDGFTDVTRPYRGRHMDHLAVGPATLGLWASIPSRVDDAGIGGTFELQAGESAWAVLDLRGEQEAWDPEKAAAELEAAKRYWRDYLAGLRYAGDRPMVKRSAMVSHLLDYAPAGSTVAALTSSLPERLGGDLNWDYRFCWVRDTSLVKTMQARLGDLASTERFLKWLVGLKSGTSSPLQVVYRIDGDPDLEVQEVPELSGYRASRPVRFGNRAAGQRQLDSLGYLADCCLTYLELGGHWQAVYTDLIERSARYVMAEWDLTDSGIWELPRLAHYVSSKVMSWVTLDRAAQIFARLGHEAPPSWTQTARKIQEEVLERGWSDARQAFTQAYGSDHLDASVLLISVMGFLPGDHPKVLSTVDRIAEVLGRDGYVYRFDDPSVVDEPPIPLGEYEGSFWACTFWLATAYAKAGDRDRARDILTKAERAGGKLGLLSEMFDPASGGFLGNTPQLFSHAGYLRAVFELEGGAADA